LVLLLSTLILACTKAPAPAPASAATSLPVATVFVAGEILTMDSDNSSVTAVAVKDGHILAVGDLSTLKATLTDHELLVDKTLAGKVIMPGFIDNHLHPALAGLLLPSQFITPWAWDLPNQIVEGVQGRNNYLDRLRVLHESMTDPEEFLVTWGYHQYFHGEINRTDINTISSTRPIIVWHRSFHEIYVNDAALVKLGITEQQVAGNPMINLTEGHFWEIGLSSIFPNLQSLILNPQRFQEGIYVGLEHARRNGITTLADQGIPLLNLELEMAHLETVLKDNDLPLRMLLIGNAKSLGIRGNQEGLKTIAALPERDNRWLRYLPKQVKLLADGAFYSQLMQMDDGYLDGHHGEWIMTPEELMSAARVYWREDYQLHIHVNGDAGLNVVLDVVRQLQAEYPRENHQTILHHFGYSTEVQNQQVARLGIGVSANPFYLWALGDKYSEIGLGAERAQYITRLGSLERLGVPISFHSDLPMAPAAPLTLAAIAASRRTAENNVLAPSEKVSVETSLRAITIEAARAIQQQDSIGSIEVGKFADFTVLEENPYDVEPETMRDIEIWGTVLGGRVYPRSAPTGAVSPPHNSRDD
ncbi:MAG: putative amidohydrolase YtcJ, partial [Halieaceae bacterium]